MLEPTREAAARPGPLTAERLPDEHARSAVFVQEAVSVPLTRLRGPPRALDPERERPQHKARVATITRRCSTWKRATPSLAPC